MALSNQSVTQEMDQGQFTFSPQYVFMRGRQLEGMYPGEPKTGIWPVTALRVMKGRGVVREEEWPYDVSVWPPVEPSGLDQLATKTPDFAYQRVGTIEECKSVIGLLGQPAMVSLNISDKWYDAPNGRISEPLAPSRPDLSLTGAEQ